MPPSTWRRTKSLVEGIRLSARFVARIAVCKKPPDIRAVDSDACFLMGDNSSWIRTVMASAKPSCRSQPHISVSTQVRAAAGESARRNVASVRLIADIDPNARWRKAEFRWISCRLAQLESLASRAREQTPVQPAIRRQRGCSAAGARHDDAAMKRSAKRLRSSSCARTCCCNWLMTVPASRHSRVPSSGSGAR